MPQGQCECGFQLPIQGKIHTTEVPETGYFGGYKTINAMNMIRSLLGVIGVTDKAHVDAVMLQVLKEDFIKELYGRLNQIDSYFDTVDYFAALTGQEKRGNVFRQYVGGIVNRIKEKVEESEKPEVYCSLGHPLIAMFEEKMESVLIESAGGRLSNRLIDRESRPGITISNAQFIKMAPEIIIIADGAAWPTEDFLAYCEDHALDAPAVKKQKIFSLHPFRSSTNPDWVLGLISLANIIHPDRFNFDLQKEADHFYREFYNSTYSDRNKHICQ